jgi:hypothetical protein
VLHLRCGQDILPQLADAGLPGDAAAWDDPLCEGPLREWPDDGARREERSAWLAARYGRGAADVLAGLERADTALARAGREDEVVLWFEHDLFDQAILAFLLHRLGEIARERTRLICIGSHPEVPDFVGLGQLTPGQLAGLFPERVPVTEAQFETADRAWAALTGGDPDGIWRLARGGGEPLPFLGAALLRYLAELPSVRNGLGQTESHGLAAFAAGADTPRHAFQAVQRFEERPWQGDAMFYATVRLLALGPAPLLAPTAGRIPKPGDPAIGGTRFEVTPEGREVLAGRADWFRIARPTRWHGSVLLEGPEPLWRWDEQAERPVRSY